jgi:hypothetical protein
MVTAAHFRSCMNLKEELTKQDIAHDWLIGWNESLITRARNEMTASFLATTHTHMFWLDADIEFAPEDVAKIWNLNADVGVGLYPMKRLDVPLAAWRGGKLVDLADCPSEPFEVDLAGTGFMCIRRDVIERLAAKAESYKGPNGKVSAVYMTPVIDGAFESEDYHFCRTAREAGFKVIADPSVTLTHWGQFAYRKD